MPQTGYCCDPSNGNCYFVTYTYNQCTGTFVYPCSSPSHPLYGDYSPPCNGACTTTTTSTTTSMAPVIP
jgi:hypothetical protein